MPNTVDYYEHHAEQYVRETSAVDMRAVYAPFLAELPPGGHILDAGCGSGRDSRVFMNQGFQVQAFDASPAMARLASQHTGQQIQVMAFSEVDWKARFDGIWACASLLHLRRAELPDALLRLGRATKPGGLLYASFKHDNTEREDSGRHFTDMNTEHLQVLLQEPLGLELKTCWLSMDRRPNRPGQEWLNRLLTTRKTAHAPSTQYSQTPGQRRNR